MLNSSWSIHLNVTASQKDLGIPPIVIIYLSGNNSVNETIFLDASESYDPDGNISIYSWDFGDGETGIGVNVSHIYKKPGEKLKGNTTDPDSRIMKTRKGFI